MLGHLWPSSRVFSHYVARGKQLDVFPLYSAIPLGAAEVMVEFLRARMSEGIRHFQLKLGGDPHEDAERTKSVLSEVGDNGVVIADANSGWKLQDAVVAARLLDGLDRVYLEQPCATLEKCRYVRERTSLPMVLDEIIIDLAACVSRVCRRHDGSVQPQKSAGWTD